MASTRRPAPANDNILARLDRNGGGNTRTSWSRSARIGVAGALLLTLVLMWLLIGLTQANLQPRREAQVVLAVPAEAETAAAPPARAESALEPAADIATNPPAMATPPAPPSVEPASLEPVPVLPMLADVVEKAPAAPAPRATPRPHPRQAHAGTPRTAGKPGTAPAAASADAATENDVALLSAILLHSPRHSAERARAEAKCNLDKKCTVAGPLPALLKATE